MSAFILDIILKKCHNLFKTIFGNGDIEMAVRVAKTIENIKAENKNIAKISNELLECFVKKNNAVGLKILMYIAKASNVGKDEIAELCEKGMPISISIRTNEFLSYCDMDIKTLKRNVQILNETSISIKDDRTESYINTLPKAEFTFKGFFNVHIYPEIIALIFALDGKFTLIDASQIMKLESKHSIRMLLLLERIANFSDKTAKRKVFELEDLNLMFGTSYKKFAEFERRVLKPAKEELDKTSKLTFLYEIDKDKIDSKRTGRANCTACTIDLISKTHIQGSLT